MFHYLMDRLVRTAVDGQRRTAKRTIALMCCAMEENALVPVVHLAERFPPFPPRHGPYAGNAMKPGLPILVTVKFDCSVLRMNLIGKRLHQWVIDVMAIGHVAELCVIDEEFDTTIYHLQGATKGFTCSH